MILVVPIILRHILKNVACKWVAIRKTINGRSMEYNKELGGKGFEACCLI